MISREIGRMFCFVRESLDNEEELDKLDDAVSWNLECKINSIRFDAVPVLVKQSMSRKIPTGSSDGVLHM